MISSNLTITIDDKQIKKLFSKHGIFPVNMILDSSRDCRDYYTGFSPGAADNYRIVDILQFLTRLNRPNNFIEKIFGVPKKDLAKPVTKYLF